MDLADHLAAAEERFRFLEEFRLAVEDPDPRRPQHLVAAEREEVRVEALDIDRHVGRRLGCVNDADRTDLMGSLRDLFDGIDRPEDVRAQGHRHDLRVAGEEVVVLLHL